MAHFNPHKRFKTGNHAGKSYIEVWRSNKDYMYYLTTLGAYWVDVVEELEKMAPEAPEKPVEARTVIGAPSTSYIRDYFKARPIDGFDMSDHIAAVYDLIEDEAGKVEYFISLKVRNNIQ